jgi:5-methyltetrahydrofolate--homocysteine methyltransferase
MEKLTEAIVGMNEEEALSIANKSIEEGVDPTKVLDACRKAMETIGQHFETGEYFLPELILAGEMMRQISEIVKPLLQDQMETTGGQLGKIVLGTVEGDIHDIGKDLVAFMLDVHGIEVIDLGVDVPPARFVEATKESEAGIVALSGFLTLAYDPMKMTVEALAEAGLRDRVKVMIGGGQIDDQIRKFTGADAYGRDAMTAVVLAKQWLKEG